MWSSGEERLTEATVSFAKPIAMSNTTKTKTSDASRVPAVQKMQHCE